MKRTLRPIVDLISEIVRRFQDHRCVTLAASVAYFSIVSLAPMLVIVLNVSSVLVEPSVGEERLMAQVADVVGREGAATIRSMIRSAQVAERSPAMTVVGIVTLVFGASTLFAKLGEALSVVFAAARPRPRGALARTVRSRLLSLTVVIGIGFLLVVSLIVDTAIVSLFDRITVFLERRLAVGLALLEFAFSTSFTAALFATVLKVMPEGHVPWRYALEGGLVTALFFTATKVGFGLLLGNQSVASSYGAAGAVVVVLLWVFVAAVVLLLGAELASVRMERTDAEA
ncbi:MAG: YihY/virulence factor BrkB family protein [Spirochaetota bacterium]